MAEKYEDLFVTKDEYFQILRDAVDQSLKGSDLWHPEDIGVHVQIVNDALSAGMSSYLRTRRQKSRT